MTSQDDLDKLNSAATSIIGRVSRLDTYTHSITAETAAEVDAVCYLRATLAPRAYIPPAGGWAAQYRTLAYLVSLVLEGGVQGDVLELGGGVSTIWTGLALRAAGKGRLTSVDHDLSYARKTHDLVLRHGLADHVRVVHAPLVDHSQLSHPSRWYDVSCLPEALPPVGLLFVDGPPAADEPLARAPAFVMLRDKLRDNALVVLDDVDRPGEQEILGNWTAEPSVDGSVSLEGQVGRSAVLRFTRSAPRGESGPST